MSFQDDVIDDVGLVFLDTVEFGQEIEFDGQTVTAVIDDDQGSFNAGSGGGFADAAGLALLNNARTLYLADVLQRRPVPEQQVEIDGELWEVDADDASVREEMGMLCIKLHRVMA